MISAMTDLGQRTVTKDSRVWFQP